MSALSLYEAKTQLSSLVEKAAAGAEFVITKNGRPKAKLVGLGSKARKPGRGKGKIRMAPDFDAPLPASLIAAFHGDPGADA